ncbi:MAG: hypothetical protein WC599_01775 [Bacteroidales bacterium]
MEIVLLILIDIKIFIDIGFFNISEANFPISAQRISQYPYTLITFIPLIK